MATYTTLRRGSNGEDVKKLQTALGFTGKDVDGIYGPKTESAVKNYQTNNNLKIDGIAGNETLGHLYGATATTSPTTNTSGATASTPTSDVDIALQRVNQLLSEAPGEFSSDWTTQLRDMYNKIIGREDFSYDLNGDALYQQYKDQAITQGNMAMMDTMGQAATMTGGYGNSYAQSVGQQAFQGYVQGVNDKFPELYQLALDQYNQEGQKLYDQMSLAAAMEQQEYAKHRDTVSDYNTKLGLAYDRLDAAKNWEYTKDRDAIEDAQWKKSFDEGVRQFDKSFSASKSGGSQISTLSVEDHNNVISQLEAFQLDEASDQKIASYLDGLVEAGTITETYADILYAEYKSKK